MGFLEEKEYALEKRKVKVLGQKYLKGEKKNVGMKAIYARNSRDNKVKESNDEGQTKDTTVKHAGNPGWLEEVNGDRSAVPGCEMLEENTEFSRLSP